MLMEGGEVAFTALADARVRGGTTGDDADVTMTGLDEMGDCLMRAFVIVGDDAVVAEIGIGVDKDNGRGFFHEDALKSFIEKRTDEQESFNLIFGEDDGEVNGQVVFVNLNGGVEEVDAFAATFFFDACDDVGVEGVDGGTVHGGFDEDAEGASKECSASVPDLVPAVIGTGKLSSCVVPPRGSRAQNASSRSFTV